MILYSMCFIFTFLQFSQLKTLFYVLSFVLLKILRSCKLVFTCFTQNLKALTKKNKHSTKVFHHDRPYFTGNFYVMRSFFLFNLYFVNSFQMLIQSPSIEKKTLKISTRGEGGQPHFHKKIGQKKSLKV